MEQKQIELNSSPTIVITDSGLGGISVLAELERLITKRNPFDSAKLVFFNAHAASGYGYNSMHDTGMKIKVFNNALKSMTDKFNPEIVLIACNTLSVIAHNTETYQKSSIPILGIVDFGVELIYKKLAGDENSIVVIYGTPTTIESDAYRRKLIDLGIEKSRIINQPCYLLETEIQNNPGSKTTAAMIGKYTAEARTKLVSKSRDYSKCFGAFCCTHYGYSNDMFLQSMNSQFVTVETLNPNKLMSDYVLNGRPNRTLYTKLSVEVYSRVDISPGEIESVGGIIKTGSPLTFEALKNYIYDENLFEFDPSEIG